MTLNLSSHYDEEYFDGGKGYHTYEDAEHFKLTAEELIRLFEPVSVLDVGCAKGYLVKAFRELGIPAWGIDISDYAISKAPEEVADYLFQYDITSGKKMTFPEVDLVISSDTMEHIPEKLAPVAIDFMRSCGDRIYIKVGTLQTPDWQHDESHITMHRLDWWANKFPDVVWEESK